MIANPSAACAVVFRQPPGRPLDRRRHPPREGHEPFFVLATGHVDFLHRREIARGETARQPDECRPQAPMYVGDLPTDEPAD
jgi:hypothetical protein